MSRKPDQVGEVLPDMTKMFQEGFTKCLAENKHRREPYYILVTGSWYADYTQFRLTYSPRDTKPPKMLNTMLWRVDNVSGEVREIWVLPADAPVGPTVPLGDVDEGLIKIAKDFTLFYN